MKTELEPYEFLARFRNGKLAGSHIQFALVTRDEKGNVLSELPQDAKAVGTTGFPLSDILNTTTQAALVKVDEVTAQLAQRDAELEVAKAELKDARAQLDAASVNVQNTTLVGSTL